nr:immunoglobulin light chain junction region [Macaca mulatta]MOX48032.1 immunoglobulin light chain junction region [Macaca mulatta]
CLQYRNYPLTF